MHKLQIEVKGHAELLEQVRLRLQDQLEKRGFLEGPKVGSMDSGAMIDYLKDGSIISIHLTEESDAGEAVLRIESEKDIPELNDAWDEALVQYGTEVASKLKSYAVDKDRVERGLK